MILMIIYRVGCVYHYISFSIDLLAYDSIYLSICVPTSVIDDVSIQKLLSRDIKDTSMFTDPHEVPINGLKNGMFWETHYLTGGCHCNYRMVEKKVTKVTKALSHYDSNHHKSSMYGTFTLW